jgi:hypothetical protein
MSGTSSRVSRSRRTVLAVLALALSVSGCSVLDGKDDKEPAGAPPSSATVSGDLVNSQFTRDGTFQSHIAARGVDDVDFVFTIYPTKATPRTNEWYPGGKKYFSFTFQAYDLSRKLRDPFRSKRKVYLRRVKVSSATVTSNGGATQHPYDLDVTAKDATFDPQPVSTRYGMLITSPKGAFEMRNQGIGEMSKDTAGVELTFRAVVYVQTRTGSSTYVKRTIKQVVPIAIFASDKDTEVADIPVNAN